MLDRFRPSPVWAFSRPPARGRPRTIEWSSWTTSRREKYPVGTLETFLIFKYNVKGSLKIITVWTSNYRKYHVVIKVGNSNKSTIQ